VIEARYSRTPIEAASGPPVRGTVKWFNPDKGFGFVELSDGSGDAFLHGSVLAESGINAVQRGDTVEVRVGPGHKGPHVTEVLSVDASTATPNRSRRRSFPGRDIDRAIFRHIGRGYQSVKCSTPRGATASSLCLTMGKTYSSTSRLLSGLGSRASAKGNPSSSMSSRAGRV